MTFPESDLPVCPPDPDCTCDSERALREREYNFCECGGRPNKMSIRFVGGLRFLGVRLTKDKWFRPCTDCHRDLRVR